jgi:hypothetical protein
VHLINKSFIKKFWAPSHEVRPPYPFTLPWRVWYPHPLHNPTQTLTLSFMDLRPHSQAKYWKLPLISRGSPFPYLTPLLPSTSSMSVDSTLQLQLPRILQAVHSPCFIPIQLIHLPFPLTLKA